MIVRRVRRFASIAAATLALLLIPSGIAARGQEEGELFGFAMGSTASAISFLYNQPSFGVPSEPTFELRKIYSLADLDSGPTGHGLGSVLWPGQVAGNAGPDLLFDTVLFNPTQFEQLDPVIQQLKDGGREAFTGRGAYPIRAEAFHPQAPATDSEDVAGGARMSASAKADEVVASSTTGGAGVPSLITFGSIFSRSNSRVEQGLAIAESVAKIADLDLFGVIHVDQIVATVRSTSDGVTARNDGSFTITGLTVYNDKKEPQLRVLVDKKGFHLTYPNGAKENDPLGRITNEIINKNLADQGFSVHIGSPIDIVDGATASRSLAGLTIHLDARGMNKLLDGLDGVIPGIKSALRNPSGPDNPLGGPLFGDNGLFSPTVAGYLATFFQGDQDLSFVFGSLAVQSAASPPFEDVVLPPVLPPDLPPAPFAPGTGGFGGGGFVTPPATGPGGSFLGPLTPVAVVGVPFWAVALAIGAAIFGATRLRLFADSVVSARAAARCPLEEMD